jgi:hypothetical protein
MARRAVPFGAFAYEFTSKGLKMPDRPAVTLSRTSTAPAVGAVWSCGLAIFGIRHASFQTS